MGSSSESDLALQTSEDDQCIFMETSLLEQAENLDEWLSRNGHFLITNDNITENLINHKLDPLLNQTNSETCLDQLSDSEVTTEADVTETIINDSEPTEAQEATPAACETTNIDRNMNSLSKHKKPSKTQSNFNKLNVLESKIKAGLNLVVSICDNKICVLFYNNDNKEAMPQCYISLNEVESQSFDLKEKHLVVELSKIQFGKTIDIIMPCLLTDLGLRLFLCPQGDCNLAFLRMGSAKLHASVHIGRKPYQCQYPDCTWAFYTRFKLKRHQETHEKKKDFVCSFPDCLRRFTTVYNLNNHKRLHERPADLPCPVKDCDQKFQTARARDKHLKCHDPSEAPFHCSVSNCNKSFFLNTGLTAHARTHSHKESELRCQWPNCGKVFEQPCRLKEHYRKHTGSRPYCCTFDDCKWTFPTSSKLKRHQSIHTNDRKFHCTIGTCTKSFLRSEHLKDHTLTHIGQRTFQCEVCAASFLGKSTLYIHIKKCHPEQHQACARALPFLQNTDKPSADALLEQAIQSLGVPSDMILGSGLLPEEPLELLDNENFSTVNLRDLD